MSRALLLDTHIFLWLRASPATLSQGERRLIDAAPCRYVSIVSFWEIALLVSLGRIDADERLFSPPPGIDLLPLQPSHCAVLAALPQHHKDPFDRMLIAQARVERLQLLTRDERIASYGRDGAAIANPGSAGSDQPD